MKVGEGQTRCFWLEPTGMVELSLRRFTYGLSKGEEARPGHRVCRAQPLRDDGYRQGCDASVKLGIEIPIRFEKAKPGGFRTIREVPVKDRPKASDRRWPKACSSCGEPFKRGDTRQVNQAEVYVRSDDGEEVAFRGYGDRSMAGALYHAWWREGWISKDAQGNERGYTGPDGICLVAVCPNGMAWEVDGPATGGGGWTRTGDPRKPETLSVTPSIVAGDYHGYLQAGVFTAHIG